MTYLVQRLTAILIKNTVEFLMRFYVLEFTRGSAGCTGSGPFAAVRDLLDTRRGQGDVSSDESPQISIYHKIDTMLNIRWLTKKPNDIPFGGDLAAPVGCIG